MVQWIIEPPTQAFEITKVRPEKSQLNVFALIESRERLGGMIFTEPNLERAQKLMQIRKELNMIIKGYENR